MPAGTEGELLVRGFNVTPGYLDAPEQTAEAIDPDGWLHTGDIAVMDEAGYNRHHRPEEGHVHHGWVQTPTRPRSSG